MAIRFDASGDYLVRTASLPSSALYTITLWMYRKSAESEGAGADHPFVALYNATPKYHQLVVRPDYNPSRLALDNNVVNIRAYGDTPINTWYFCAMQGGDATQNGDMADPADESIVLHNLTQAGTWTPTGMSLGMNVQTSEWSDCRIAYVKIWDHILSEAEINAEMFHSDPQHTVGVHLYSYLDDKDDLADKSGNGRTWTAGGTLTTEDSPAGVTRDTVGRNPVAMGFVLE